MQKPKIPSKESFPEFAEAVAKQNELAAALRRTKDRIEELKASRPRRASTLDADTLLASEEATPATSPYRWTEEMTQARERYSALGAALKAQRLVVRDIGIEVAEKIAEAVRPQYAELQQRMVPAVLALGKLADEECKFRECLQEAGIPPSLIGQNPLNHMRLGSTDNGSHAARFLAVAEKVHGAKVPR